MGEFSKKNVFTPVFGPNATSSVFLSPPLSDEVRRPSKSESKIALTLQEGKPAFLLDDDDREQESDIKVDILEELYKRCMVPIIGKNILDYLSEKELLRVSHVSSTWKYIIQLHLKSGKRLRRYVKHKKTLAITTKENQDQICKKPMYKPLAIGTPLQQRNERIEISESGPSTSIINRDSKSSYRHCPVCHTPSRTTFKQIGHCKKCDQDFCIHCFYTNCNHSPTCVVIGGSGVSGSPRRLDTRNSRRSSSSKESKARLKRL